MFRVGLDVFEVNYVSSRLLARHEHNTKIIGSICEILLGRAVYEARARKNEECYNCASHSFCFKGNYLSAYTMLHSLFTTYSHTSTLHVQWTREGMATLAALNVLVRYFLLRFVFHYNHYSSYVSNITLMCQNITKLPFKKQKNSLPPYV